jgi:hypothetical protein
MRNRAPGRLGEPVEFGFAEPRDAIARFCFNPSASSRNSSVVASRAAFIASA